MTLLHDLPSEILFQILLGVPPPSVLAIQQVCRKFNDLAQPLLWRSHCRTQFSYWRPEHKIATKLAQKASRVDWKDLFRTRHLADRAISDELEEILSSQTGRIERSEKILAHDYDAKDTLLRNFHINDDCEDVLARRYELEVCNYYSDAVLGGLHRAMAIEEWTRIRDGQPVSLERALVAFDLFVLRDREGDFDEVAARLDHIAKAVQLEDPQCSEAAPRHKAKLIAGYLQRNGITGVADENQYHNLRNNFISRALQSCDHESLPLISVIIFCAVSTRLGVEAEPCGFPFHVYAIVKPPVGHDLDGRPVDDTLEHQWSYMDPFNSDREVYRSDLEAQLKDMGVPAADHNMLLSASSVADMVRRTSRNIIESIQTNSHVTSIGSVDPEPDSAFYGALWALLILPEPHSGLFQRARFLPYILEYLERQYVFDVRLIERILLPIFEGTPHWQQLHDAVRVMRLGDSIPKQIKSRNAEIASSVRFKVGQIFRHKRYTYQAVITGWDVECAQSEDWMFQMGVDRLSKGRHQSFYHVLVEDKSVRYVAEENIDSTSGPVGTNLMSLAGRHFKRWDNASKTFVSNIRDEYPND
ncbi:MAG: hypothetical protein L6R37_006476 [Teloschistes peruensis]|nr:MAG: hypothetical protein L6R37_006476 [Teloschistes peruensis]